MLRYVAHQSSLMHRCRCPPKLARTLSLSLKPQKPLTFQFLLYSIVYLIDLKLPKPVVKSLLGAAWLVLDIQLQQSPRLNLFELLQVLQIIIQYGEPTCVRACSFAPKKFSSHQLKLTALCRVVGTAHSTN